MEDDPVLIAQINWTMDLYDLYDELNAWLIGVCIERR